MSDEEVSKVYEVTCRLCKSVFKKYGDEELQSFLRCPCPLCYVWEGNMTLSTMKLIDASVDEKTPANPPNAL